MNRDDEEYVVGVVTEQFKFFGPFPARFAEIASPECIQNIMLLMQEVSSAETTPFIRITEREVSKKDNVFISKMMKLDWRDRPSAKELLEDEWWKDDDEPA